MAVIYVIGDIGLSVGKGIDETQLRLGVVATERPDRFEPGAQLFGFATRRVAPAVRQYAEVVLHAPDHPLPIPGRPGPQFDTAEEARRGCPGRRRTGTWHQKQSK